MTQNRVSIFIFHLIITAAVLLRRVQRLVHSQKIARYPVEVSPRLLVCAIHVPEDMALLVLMVEENSQNSLLQRLTLDAEQDLEAKICR